MQNPPIALNDNRRNGKLASCEPCRKAKVRCDHQRPVCSRCQLRGIQAKCFVHPAPLTKPRDAGEGVIPPISRSRQSSAAPSKRRATEPLVPITSSRSPVAARPSPVVREAMIIEENPTTHKGIPSPAYIGDHRTKARRSMEKVVSHLKHIDMIEDLIKKNYAISPFALVPTSLLLPAVSYFRQHWEGHGPRKVEKIAAMLLASTHMPMDLNPQMTPSEYIQAYLDEQPRLEFLGLVYTIAARSCLFANDLPQNEKIKFVQSMFHCSGKVVSLAHKLLPQVNDVLIWLVYENLLICTHITGDASLASWRKLGDLATDILTLGLHRNSYSDKLPFFMVEMRRRTFAVAYNIDKFMATLLERPPRLPKRYIDFRLPLDLPEAVIFSDDPPSSARLKELVTPEGWNIEPVYSRQAWARLRFIIASFREEMFEVDYLPWTDERIPELRLISTRCHEAWAALPAYLRYSPDCWTSGIPTTRSTMLTTTYLSYRHLDFQIFELIEKGDPSVTSSLLEVSDDIINVILQLGASRTRANFLNYDFAYLTIAYGIPSALKLAAALAADHHSGSISLPAGLTRSALIRKLSVFVASLESLHELGDMDKKTSTQAVQTLSQILDDVLSPPGASSAVIVPETLLTPARAGLSTFDTHTIESENIATDWLWDQEIDWTNLNSEWIKF